MKCEKIYKDEIKTKKKVKNLKGQTDIMGYVIGAAISLYVIVNVLIPAITSFMGTDFTTLGQLGGLLQLIPMFIVLVIIYAFYKKMA